MYLSCSAEHFVVCTGRPSLWGYDDFELCLYQKGTQAPLQRVHPYGPSRGTVTALWSPNGQKLAMTWKFGPGNLDLDVAYISCTTFADRQVCIRRRCICYHL